MSRECWGSIRHPNNGNVVVPITLSLSKGPSSSLAPAADRWHAALQAAYEELCDAVDRGEDTLIDPYGAEDLGEFFATATEVFFERAGEFRTAHPRLHAQLREFYGVDPADWSGDR